MGIARFVYRRSIRKALPQTGYHKFNNVETVTKPQKPLDKKFGITGDKTREGGITKCLDNAVEPDNTVTIVGGGIGISAVHALHHGTSVTIYEGGEESVKIIEQNIALNIGEDAAAQVIHAVVGTARDVYGGSTSQRVVPPSDLEPCDVLELDCEGAELEILEQLQFKPGVVVVEIHPWLFDGEYDAVLQVLEEKGYSIVGRYGHEGREIDEEECRFLLYLSSKGREKYSMSGARYPVVVTAIHKSEVSD